MDLNCLILIIHQIYYVDIEDYMEKNYGSKYYESELKEFPHPRSIKGIEFAARYRGMEVGLRYAEVFKILRWIKN